jgi:two-component system response regulator FixJ
VKPQRTVCVVDDDEAVARSLEALLGSVGLRVETFGSAQDFLDRADPRRGPIGCLVLDVRMPGMSGLELQERLAAEGQPIPIVFITGHGDVRMAVRAVKAGAVDFIEKPFRDQDLLDCIHKVLAADGAQRPEAREWAAVVARLESLTPREREVMELVIEGRSSKLIARQLGISAKTVEFHRARVMEKMQVASALDLVRVVLTARQSAATGGAGRSRSADG